MDPSIHNPAAWSLMNKDNRSDWTSSLGILIILYCIYIPFGVVVAKQPLNASRVSSLSLTAGIVSCIVLLTAFGLRANEYRSMSTGRRVLYVMQGFTYALVICICVAILVTKYIYAIPKLQTQCPEDEPTFCQPTVSSMIVHWTV